MHSPCPAGVEEQMDFFGTPQTCALPSTTSELSDTAGSETETTAMTGARVLESLRAPQLALRLPRLPLNHFEWDERELCAFRDGVLVSNLAMLNDSRITPKLRNQIVAWIAAPKRSNEDLKTDPLSFQACCLSAGVDFEEMREQTLLIVAPDLISHLE